MEPVGISTTLLLTTEVVLIVLFILSERLKIWADVACCAFLGLFVHSLITQFSTIGSDEWEILSASIFALSFSFIGWSTFRRNINSVDSTEKYESSDAERSRDFIDGINEIAVHDDRLKTLGIMNARLVHELSHPISTLMLRFEELKRQRMNSDSEAFEKAMTSIQRQLAHLNHLTQSVKTYASGHNEGGNSFVAVAEIFKFSAELCDVWAASKNVKVVWPQNLPSIEVSGGLTLQTQVLLNLLKNATDAVTELSEVSQRWVKVEINERGGAVEFAISNGGPALSKGLQRNLFKPFFTTKKSGRGLGLGLALCRELTESVGGEIWYDESSRSPRFVVRYPFLPSVSQSSDELHPFEKVA